MGAAAETLINSAAAPSPQVEHPRIRIQTERPQMQTTISRHSGLAATALSSLAVALAALAIAAPAAFARDDSITSFDGTRIALSFFPAAGLGAGEKAPTVLVGPGWGVPRDTDQSSQSLDSFGTIGLGPLRAAGYNVLTWDPRGFGQSGGTVEVDSPAYEARDASALIDYVARQPEALLDKPGDPRVGMAGGSYGGGIQLVTAATDQRVDAITPDIAWNSLVTSLYKAQAVKGGWSNLLFGLGVASSTVPGLAAGETGNLDPHIASAYQSGLTTGQISDEDIQWFASRGPGSLVGQIKAPTLLLEGTADTLFTLDEAIRNYAILRSKRVPSKMVWFCGGHGACLTDAGPAKFTEQQILNWFARYLDRNRAVATGPRFQWIADDGLVRTAADYPLPLKQLVTATGSGTLAFTADAVTSGSPIAATPGTNAVRVPIAAPAAGSQIVGAPTLTIAYSGLANQTSVLLYAQIVDNKRHLVVGNMVTPFRVVLDGAAHTVSVNLEDIAASVASDSSYTLEIVPYTAVYGPQRAAGAITMSKIDVSLPVASTP
jgi:ABC-2 type transport system ATP-binding protein